MQKHFTISGIDTREISVVLQGPVSAITALAVGSLRTYLPGSEIILSTWEGSKVDDLDYDELVLNEDPGAPPLDMVRPLRNNSNRQLVSTKAGLTRAHRKYSLKLRTDFHLQDNSFLYHWNCYPKANPDHVIFEHRVIISSLFTQEYCGIDHTPTPFHYSDFWHFGLTTDLKDYFMSTPLSTMDELFDPNRIYLYPNKIPAKDRYLKYAPEQYYGYSWAKRHLQDAVDFADVTDSNLDNIAISKLLLYNNFIILSPLESGIFSFKYGAAMQQEQKFEPGIVSHAFFLQKYKEYCDNDFIIPNAVRSCAADRLHKHLHRLFGPIESALQWLGEPFSIAYYAIIFICNKLRGK